MVTKILNKIIGALAAGLLVIGLMGSCASQDRYGTATEQIVGQGGDAYAIAQAAYLDALKTYNDLGERYLKYRDYIEVAYPDVHLEAMYLFQEMNKMLVMWEGFAQAGILPAEAGSNFKIHADIIIQLLLELDQALESGELEL